MIFNFCMFNHSALGQRSLEDIASIMGHQLQALGHVATWERGNHKLIGAEAGYNLIFEGFVDASVAEMARAHCEGARFVIVATEEPTPDGFNHGISAEMRLRQEKFGHAARLSSGILHLVPGAHVTSWYNQFAPARYAELGYAPTLVRANYAEPTFEFGFYGSVSLRRKRILRRLANATGREKAVRIMMDFRTQEERDKRMQEAKVIVQLRKFDAMGLVSSSRCNTALSIGRPVVAEPHLLSKPWDEVVHFAKSEESFIAEAMAVKAAWRGVYAAQFAKFKEKFTPEISVGRPLREIGVLPTSEARAA